LQGGAATFTFTASYNKKETADVLIVLLINNLLLSSFLSQNYLLKMEKDEQICRLWFIECEGAETAYYVIDFNPLDQCISVALRNSPLFVSHAADNIYKCAFLTNIRLPCRNCRCGFQSRGDCTAWW